MEWNGKKRVPDEVVEEALDEEAPVEE